MNAGTDMPVERGYALLAQADAAELEALADAALARAEDVVVLAGPEVVSAPIRVRTPMDTTVVVGHVALTTCSVQVGGLVGHGVRSGRDLPGAVAAAVCAAVLEAGDPPAGLRDLLARADASRTAAALRRAETVAATRWGDGS